MIKFINKDHQVIKMIRSEQVQSLHHTQILTDENYVSDHLSIQMTHLEDETIKEAEFIAIPVKDHEFMHHLFWIKDYMYDNDVLNIQGVQAIIEMLSKSAIIDYRPQNTTLRSAVEQALNGTGVTARYVGNFGNNSSNAYFTSVWDALKKYCLTWNAEMQCFVEITDSGVGALFIDFRSKIGVNNGARVVYGHNALEIVKEEERSEIYTALIGRGKAEEVGETEDGDSTYGRKINFKDISWSTSKGNPVNKPIGQYYVEIPSATLRYGINQGGVMKPKIGFVDVDTDDPEELLARTYATLQEVSRPKALFRTTSAYLNAEVGDEVRVVRPDKDIDYSTRIFEITWDRLNNVAVSVKLGDKIIESQSSRERRITSSASVRAIEEVNRVIEGSVNYIVSANGLNRNYYGSIDPRDDGHTPFLNDIWYRPDPDSDGDTILYIWNGTIWEEVTRTFNNEKVTKIMEDMQEIVNNIDLDFEVTIEDVRNALDGAGEIDLDHIFARLITDGRFGTMFMQNANAIGLVYEEDGETQSIIGIIDGTPYIKGANIILNGDTIVDGSFAVTEEMITPEVIVDRLTAHELIDATDINVINLNANSISGGNLELANGLKITNNGHPVLSVTSDGKFLFDATGAGVATKEELENIELTPGPQGVPGKDGKDGNPTYTWIRYADNSSGVGISNDPTGKTYIGFAYNQTTPTESNTASDYTWTKIVGPQGNQGVRGPDGSDGQTTYTWIKYAPTADGTNMTDTPQSNTTHIGIAVNKLTQAESSNKADYTWSKFKGDKGDTGEAGPRGLRGLEGPQGDQGIEGPKGADGKSSYTHIAYATGSSGGNFSTSHFSGATYIGMYVSDEPDDSTDYRDYNWSLIKGADGSRGLEGPKGDDGLTPYFHTAWANNSTGSSGFSTTVSANKLFIGTVTTFEPDDPTDPNVYSWTKIKGDKGDKGDTGERGATGSIGPRGATGTSVSSVTEYYLASSSSSGVTTGTSGWSTSMKTMTATLKYLWNYEKINFSDGTSQDTIPVIIGVYGDKGGTGATGRSITGITEHYLASASKTGVTRSTSGWTTTMQTTTATKKYLWNYETITWSSGTSPTYVDPIIIGVHGDKGDKGATGDKGAKGDQGIEGPKGLDGQSQYVHIRYSANSSGSGNVANPTTSTKYIGIAVTNSSTRPTANNAYTWSKYQGDDGSQGPQGIKGDKGANGQPTYTWVKYADTPTSGMNDFPNGKKYIGLAFNKTTATESNSYSQYAWSLMPQNIALGVRNLVPWTDFTNYRENISKWSRWSAGSIWQASQAGKFLLFRNNNTNRTGSGTAGIISPPFYKNVESGRVYTLRFLAVTDVNIPTPFDYCFLMNIDGVVRVNGNTTNQPLSIPSKIPNYESTRGLPNGADLYELTFTSQFTGPASIMLASSIDLSEQSSHWITEPMIVEGDTISRDWQPAPEDVEQLMHNNVDGKIDGVNTELSAHWEAIGDKVSTNAFTNALNSLKSDYEAGLIEASKVPERVDTLLERNEKMISRLGENIAKWEFLDTHIIMGDEGLYIGEIEGDAKILIGTDRISFMQGINEIAYISGQQMYINRSINVESMQIGSHVQMKIDNNNTVIQWVGG